MFSSLWGGSPNILLRQFGHIFVYSVASFVRNILSYFMILMFFRRYLASWIFVLRACGRKCIFSGIFSTYYIKLLHYISLIILNCRYFIDPDPATVACLKGEQKVRRPWWASSCLSIVFIKAAKRNRQSRVVSLKLEP